MVNPIIIIGVLPIVLLGHTLDLLLTKESDTKYCIDLATAHPTFEPTQQPSTGVRWKTDQPSKARSVKPTIQPTKRRQPTYQPTIQSNNTLRTLNKIP